ncbi:MAG: extracellular solute-binding protein [Chloroflexota bacterium]|nr:extracellular solute-binding protein [Chloroflexota bacterium]
MPTQSAVALMVIACLVTAALAGCGAEITPVEPVTITFAFPESQDQSLYQPIAAAFQESHPNITINLRPDPNNQWVRDESREVDAFVSWSASSLVADGTPLVLSLDPLLARTPELPLDDFYPRSLDMFRWEGALWALPAEVDLQVLYYNKDLFDESKVAYPQAGWTWDDLLLTAQRLTTVEGDPWSYTGHYGLASNPTWWDYVPFVYQHGGELFQFDDPLMEEAIQWYADLALVHGVMPRPEDVLYGNMYDMFQEEKAAMWIGSLGSRNGMAGSMGMGIGAPWNFDWGLVPLPGDQTEATLYGGRGYYITSRTAHVEEAWAWIQYLSSQPTGRALPARRSVAEASGFRELAGDQVVTAALYAVEHLVPPITLADVSPEMAETYLEIVESVVNGELTAAEAMATLRGEDGD